MTPPSLSDPVQAQAAVEPAAEHEEAQPGIRQMSQAPPTDDPPPVDLESLQERCLGSREVAARALNLFDTGLARDFGVLADAVLKGDARSVAAKAHAIKGAAANVSAEPIRRLASELETLGKDDAVSQSQSCLDQLQVEVARFRSHLASALAELAAADPQPR